MTYVYLLFTESPVVREQKLALTRTRPDFDPTIIIKEWYGLAGKPVGTAWGTYLEVWLMDDELAAQIYSRASIVRP